MQRLLHYIAVYLVKFVLFTGRVLRAPFLFMTRFIRHLFLFLGRTLIKPPLILLYSALLSLKVKYKKTFPQGNVFLIISTRHGMIHGIIALITFSVATTTLYAQRDPMETTTHNNKPILFALLPSPYEEEGALSARSIPQETSEEVTLEELPAPPPPAQ